MQQLASALPAPFPLSVKAVLFDLDGTLVHSAPDLVGAANLMLKELGRAEEPMEKVISWVGNGMQRFVKRALTGQMNGEPDEALFERGLELFKKHYAANLVVLTKPYSGTIEALETLTARGFALACVTNKSGMFTLPLLQQMDLAKYFRSVVSGDTMPVRKPDPAPLLRACSELGVEPAKAVLIGDSANDVDGAKAAGIYSICVSYGYNHGRDVRELKPDAVVDSLTELPQYLRLCTT